MTNELLKKKKREREARFRNESAAEVKTEEAVVTDPKVLARQARFGVVTQDAQKEKKIARQKRFQDTLKVRKFLTQLRILDEDK